MSTIKQNDMDKPRPVDDEALEIFLDEHIQHEILHHLYLIHKNDAVHHLKETEKAKHIDAYKPLIYATEPVSYGINYFAKIRVTKEGACVHARVHKNNDGKVNFHSLHAPKESAIFTESDALTYFEA